MSRSNYYKKIQSKKPENMLQNRCNTLMEQIVSKGEITMKDLVIVLSFKTGIPIDKLKIKELDDKSLEKILKELAYML